MSGFTLVIIVMLIMFAAVAIVLTQDDEPEDRGNEINDERAAVPALEPGDAPDQAPLPVVEWDDQSTVHSIDEIRTLETSDEPVE